MTSENMNKLKRLSQFMFLTCNFIAVAMVVIGLIFATQWFIEPTSSALFANIASIENPNQPFGIKVATLCVNAITLALTVYGLMALSKLFAAFRRDEMFSHVSASHVSTAGKIFLIAAIYSVVANTITVGLLTWNNAPGNRQLAIGIDGDMILMLLFAGTLFAVGHALKIAAEIAQENKGFV